MVGITRNKVICLLEAWYGLRMFAASWHLLASPGISWHSNHSAHPAPQNPQMEWLSCHVIPKRKQTFTPCYKLSGYAADSGNKGKQVRIVGLLFHWTSRSQMTGCTKHHTAPARCTQHPHMVSSLRHWQQWWGVCQDILRERSDSATRLLDVVFALDKNPLGCHME